MLKSRILIVEDEILISSGIKHTLAQQGYDCIIVDNGEDAISRFQDFSPHLVLMDIGLKGKLDGLSAAAIIRRQSQVPIVYVSEQSSRSVFELAKETKPANYINKPFSDGELIKAVELALCQPVQATHTEPIPPIGERISDGFFVFKDGEYKKILFADILFIQADGMRTLLYCTTDRTYSIAMSSNHVISQVDWPGFVKTGKSNYVNIHKVDSIRGDELRIEKYSVTLGKTYKEAFLSRIKKLQQK